jgi:hypothetical protein
MMVRDFGYEVEGSGSNGQTFTVTGEVTVSSWEKVFDEANRDCFIKLTSGKAVYGQPGVGCGGPYTIKKMTIELREVGRA